MYPFVAGQKSSPSYTLQFSYPIIGGPTLVKIRDKASRILLDRRATGTKFFFIRSMASSNKSVPSLEMDNKKYYKKLYAFNFVIENI